MEPSKADRKKPVDDALDADGLAYAGRPSPKSEYWLRSLVQNASAIIAVLEVDATLRYVSPAVERVLGYRGEELVGTSAFDYVHPEDIDYVSGAFTEVLENDGVLPPVEFRVRAADGSWRRLEVARTNLLSDPNVGGVVINARDVTQRKEAEEALRESEERYRRRSQELALLHQVRTALAQELDLPTVFYKVVEAIAETYGYTQVSAYLLEGDELVLQQEVGYERAIERIPLTEGVSGRAVRTGKPILLEDVRTDPDFIGAIEGIASEICVPLFDDGEAVGFINVESVGGVKLTQDDLRVMIALGEHVSVAISRARLYTRVRESEERFRAMTQNSSDLVTLLRADGTIRYQSAAIEHMLGYSADELVGENAFDYVHPEDLGRVEMAFAEGLKDPGRRPSAEYRFRHKDGSWVWLESVGANLLDDPRVGEFVVNSRDVTERRRAENALRESEQRFRSSFRDAAIGMALVAPDGRWLQANRSLCEIVGYPEEELLEKTFLDITHPDDLDADVEQAKRMLAGEIETYQMEKRYIHREGHVVWVLLSVSLVHDEDGKPLYFVSQMQDISERKRAEEERKESERRFSSVVSNAHAYVYRCLNEPGYQNEFASDYALELTGYSPEDLVVGGKVRFGDLILDEDRDRVWAELQEALAERRSFRLRYAIRRKDGTVRHVQEYGQGVFDEDGNVVALEGLVYDVTELVGTEERLRESERRLRTIIGNVPVVLFALDRDGVFTLLEGKGVQVLGLRPGEVLGRSVFEVYKDVPEIPEHVRRALGGAEASVTVEVGELAFESFFSPVYDEGGEVGGVIGVAADVTERKRAEKRLAHQAFHDSLTDLPNRTLFIDRLQQALRGNGRRPGRMGAVLFMDLDGFKVINDSLGHEVGDRLLVSVAERLKGCLRPEDDLARFGGDEFVVLLEAVQDPEDAVRVAERIVETLQEPFLLHGRELFVTVSIGIALSGARGKRPEDLLRDADTAMYKAKEETASSYRVYDPALHERAMSRLELENDLRKAIERGEFSLLYQPKVRLKEVDTVAEVEALLRWHHPTKGLLGPDEFVPLAEETGLLVPIGRWVLREACRRVKGWQERYPSSPPLVACVNISASQVRPYLLRDVKAALRESGIEARSLTLEITESALVKDVETSMVLLRELRGLGVRFAIDDFGSEYSSLSYLRRLPVDFVKLDSSFVRDLGEDSREVIIVESIISLAHSLGLEVVGEGVETAEQLEHLRSLGCDLAQGHYLGEPLPGNELASLLADLWGH